MRAGGYILNKFIFASLTDKKIQFKFEEEFSLSNDFEDSRNKKIKIPTFLTFFNNFK